MTDEQTHPTTQSPLATATTLPRRAYVGWFLAVLLGVVWLFAGVTKALEPFDFARQVASFQLVPSGRLQTVTAWGLLVVECTLGGALIIGYRLRWALIGAGLLTLVFLGALGWVVVAGIPVEDCGCFGSQFKRSPKEAIVEDMVMLTVTLVAGWLVWRSNTPPHAERTRWRGVVVALCAAVGLLTPLAFGFPLGGDNWSSVKVSGTTISVAAGERLVALIDTECTHCQESVPKLNAYVGLKDFPTFVALCSNEDWRRKFFVQRFSAKFELGEISKDDFKRLLADGDTPRLVLLRNGKVLATWNIDPPTPEEVRRVRARK
ncbi:MAG: MauE/DoxX family redox-associated membrane protein [Chloracidobacterium sp.]|uniref:Methylamine utilisation protein MauE domain-containing protein n=1 Tax=Chloracidobacterium validum TaxID=2821543 RepID=A0ABX8BD04_9BACT|nr:MauE/DoxX family redox-associated membrane protein [Chloracidobacterium validum]QUW03410.1 hypothetical protein J8C06_02945 [Chloracidobacterium validum]